MKIIINKIEYEYIIKEINCDDTIIICDVDGLAVKKADKFDQGNLGLVVTKINSGVLICKLTSKNKP